MSKIKVAAREKSTKSRKRATNGKLNADANGAVDQASPWGAEVPYFPLSTKELTPQRIYHAGEILGIRYSRLKLLLTRHDEEPQGGTPLEMIERCGKGLQDMIGELRGFALNGWLHHDNREMRDAVLADTQRVLADAAIGADDVRCLAGACRRYFEAHPEDAPKWDAIFNELTSGKVAS